MKKNKFRIVLAIVVIFQIGSVFFLPLAEFGVATVYADGLDACSKAGGFINGEPCQTQGIAPVSGITIATGYYCCKEQGATTKCDIIKPEEAPKIKYRHLDGLRCHYWGEDTKFVIVPSPRDSEDSTGYYCCEKKRDLREDKCEELKGVFTRARADESNNCVEKCKNDFHDDVIPVPGVNFPFCCCKNPHAQIQTAAPKNQDFYLQIPIGKLTTITADEFKSGKSIPTYISTLYRWLVGFVLILGMIALMVGGVIWILAGGSEKRIGMARGVIKNSLVGIFLALGSYLFLWTISPNLVQFRPILLSQVKEITLALIGKNVLPGAEGKVAEFNAMACPSHSETEFDAYFTAYYKPPYGEKGNYEDFWCNAAMQCWCPNNNKRDQTRICKNSNGYEWHPCVEFPQSTPYCTDTSSGKTPQENYSIAADQTCFKVGCKLEVKGKTYEVQDKGDLIKGRHFDLYAGTSLRNADFSGVQKVKMVDPATCLR